MKRNRDLLNGLRFEAGSDSGMTREVVYWILLGWAIFVFAAYLYGGVERILNAFS